MNIIRRRGAVAFFLTLGVCLVAAAVTLNVGWIVFNGRLHPVLLVIGIVLFILMIAGMIVNTIFLLREIKRNERQDSFLNAVTHELKTPIASMQLSLETLQQRELSDEQRQDFYHRMTEDNSRLLATVEQILRAGDAIQRKSARHRLPVDMRLLVAECVEETKRRYQLDSAAVAFTDLSPDVAMIVAAEASDLRSAVLNILDNAVKYSLEKITIATELDHTRDGRIEVRVTDKGVGIPPAVLKRVFLRFYRVTGRDAANVKGTGLGLFIVRSIARRYSGDATVQSEGAGKGATVTLWLPAAGQREGRHA